MSDASQDWTVALSGPLATRAPLLAGLSNSGIGVDWPVEMHHGHGLPDTTDGEADPTVGWILARTPDLDVMADELGRAGWVVRMHWPTPRCGACQGHGQVNGEDCTHCDGIGRTPMPHRPDGV